MEERVASTTISDRRWKNLIDPSRAKDLTVFDFDLAAVLLSSYVPTSSSYDKGLFVVIIIRRARRRRTILCSMVASGKKPTITNLLAVS
jgi:hypothetical protein